MIPCCVDQSWISPSLAYAKRMLPMFAADRRSSEAGFGLAARGVGEQAELITGLRKQSEKKQPLVLKVGRGGGPSGLHAQTTVCAPGARARLLT